MTDPKINLTELRANLHEQAGAWKRRLRETLTHYTTNQP